MKRIIMFLAAAAAALGCSGQSSKGAADEQTLLSIKVEPPFSVEYGQGD